MSPLVGVQFTSSLFVGVVTITHVELTENSITMEIFGEEEPRKFNLQKAKWYFENGTFVKL